MTYKILTLDTKKVIYRSSVRSATDSAAKNARIEPLRGEEVTKIVKSRSDSDNGETKEHNMAIFHPEELVGRTFLLDRPEDGQKHRAKIVRAIEDHENDVSKEPD